MSTQPTTQPAGAQATPQQPTPERIFQTLNAHQQTAALKAAIELDIFTAIAEGADTAAAAAARREASERGVRILCDYLCVLEFLQKRDGRYQLTPESELFLVRTSPAYIGGMAGFLTSPPLFEAFRQLTESVRRGATVLAEQGSMTPEHPMWEEFARSMATMARPLAEAVAQTVGAKEMGACKVLDLAAGHGFYGVTIARHNPQAQVYALDWQNVLPYARRNAEEAGVAARFHELPGSAFDVDFGADYDLVLLTNFLHHFDAQTNERLLRKVHAALKPTGRAVTLEFVPNEDRVSPPVEASFALIMLGSTQAGDAYTFAELERMFARAGFSRSEIFPAPPQHIIVSDK